MWNSSKLIKFITLKHLANQSTLNKALVIKIKKVWTVAFMKAWNSLVVQNWKKTVDGENLHFKVLSNRFWLTLKNYPWFNNAVHGRPSIKRTSWKGKLYVNKSRLDVQFIKKITLEMVIGQGA